MGIITVTVGYAPPLPMGVKYHEKIMVLIKFQNSLTPSNLSLDIMITLPRERWSL